MGVHTYIILAYRFSNCLDDVSVMMIYIHNVTSDFDDVNEKVNETTSLTGKYSLSASRKFKA